MEQFLKDFLNDDSVCIGLCDLKRKLDEAKFNYATQVQYQQPVQQTAQKPQKQTLAQKFAEQQKEYAAKQAYLEEQRRKYAIMQQQVEEMERQAALRQRQMTAQQVQQQKVVQQKPVYKSAQPMYSNQNTYINSAFQQNAPQSRVIVNGNMKKVVSAAVPARY